MEHSSFAPAISLIALALIHFFAGRLRFLERLPRNRWLSFAGGISVAYVFVQLLPELATAQEHFGASTKLPQFLERHIYIASLVGLLIFYSLERYASIRPNGNDNLLFYTHVLSFGLYNVLIGYLLVDGESVEGSLLLYVIAMGTHFIVNDFGLREHFKQKYDREGKWILCLAILMGGGLAFVSSIDRNLLYLLFALLAGSVIMNVLKEELPDEKQSKLLPFVGGAFLYGALILFI